MASGANPLPPGLVWVILGALILIAIVSVVVPLMARSKPPSDPNLWKAGVFYVNPSDPALFVPKRYGIGYTINFGNRWAWLVMGILAVLIAAPFLFTAISLATIRHSLSSH
jgi:uncharacterized membrane protein